VNIWDTGSGDEEDLRSSVSVQLCKDIVIKSVLYMYFFILCCIPIQHVYENCGAAILVLDVNDYESAKKARALGNTVKTMAQSFPTRFLVVGHKVLYHI